MKSHQIKPAFKWADRHITLDNKILHLPQHLESYDEHSIPSFESPEIFGRKAPIKVEYCSGNGSWIIDRAQRFPEYNWIAVEMQFGRAAKIASKVINRNMNNLLVVCGQAQTFSEFFLQDNAISEIFINFPDPWPKKRHAKHRLIKEPFVNDIVRTLEPNGDFWFVSDDWPYFEHTLTLCQQHQSLSPYFPEPHYKTDLHEYGDSFFYDLWKGKGRTIHYLKFSKDA